MRPTSRSLVLTIGLGLTGGLAGAAPAAAQVVTVTPSVRTALAPAASPDASLILPASLSFDDQQPAYRRGGGRSGGIGARVFGILDVEHMAASQSFDAVVGTSTLFGFGAGADITGLAGGLFVRVALSDMPKSGTRSDGSIFSNGIGVDVKMVPIDIAAGWRFENLLGHGVTPFAGAGAFMLHYSETTPSGSTTDNTRQYFKGYEAFGGVDVSLGHMLTIAPEVDYRGVPNAIGTGGVSQDFNETNLGGVAFRLTVGARFGGGR